MAFAKTQDNSAQSKTFARFQLSVSLPSPHFERAERDCLTQALVSLTSHIGPAARLIDAGPFTGLVSSQILAALERPKSCVTFNQKSKGQSTKKLSPISTTAEIINLDHDELTLPWPLEQMGAGKTLVFVSGGGIGFYTQSDADRFMSCASSALSVGDYVAISVEHPRDGALLETAYRDYGSQLIGQSLARMGRAEGLEPRLFFDASHRLLHMGVIAQDNASLIQHQQRHSFKAGQWISFGGVQFYDAKALASFHPDFELHEQWTSQDQIVSLLLLRKR